MWRLDRADFKPLGRVLRGFFIYAGASLVLRAVTAGVALILIHYLTVAEFGLLSLINSLLAIVPLFLQLGLRQAFWIEYFHARDRWPALLNLTVFAYTVLALPLAAVVACVLPYVCRSFCGVCLSPVVVTLVVLYSFVHFFAELFLTLLRCQMRAGMLAFVQLAAAAVLVVVGILMVVYLHLGMVGWLCANVASVCTICICAVAFYIVGGLISAWDLTAWWPQAGALMRLGLPFIPNIICAWIAGVGLRWQLAGTGDLAAVGIYGLVDVANQAFNLCILYPLTASYVPYILQQFTQTSDARTVARRNRQFMGLAMAGTAIVGVCGIVVARTAAPFFLPPAYREATSYLLPVVIANVLVVGTYFLSAPLVYTKRVWPLVFAHAGWAAAAIFLGRVLIPHYSVWGAVYAAAGAAGVFFISNLLMNHCRWRE